MIGRAVRYPPVGGQVGVRVYHPQQLEFTGLSRAIQPFTDLSRSGSGVDQRRGHRQGSAGHPGRGETPGVGMEARVEQRRGHRVHRPTCRSDDVVDQLRRARRLGHYPVDAAEPGIRLVMIDVDHRASCVPVGLLRRTQITAIQGGRIDDHESVGVGQTLRTHHRNLRHVHHEPEPVRDATWRQAHPAHTPVAAGPGPGRRQHRAQTVGIRHHVSDYRRTPHGLDRGDYFLRDGHG